MKYIKNNLFILVMLLSVAVFAQQKIDSLIKFEKTSYSFGEVKQNIPITYEFMFTNPSKVPLVIESAVAECGCTTPEFPTKPIMPGKSGKIKVTYDAKTLGSFTKKITVKLVNVTESKILTITGEVIK